MRYCRDGAVFGPVFPLIRYLSSAIVAGNASIRYLASAIFKKRTLWRPKTSTTLTPLHIPSRAQTYRLARRDLKEPRLAFFFHNGMTNLGLGLGLLHGFYTVIDTYMPFD